MPPQDYEDSSYIPCKQSQASREEPTGSPLRTPLVLFQVPPSCPLVFPTPVITCFSLMCSSCFQMSPLPCVFNPPALIFLSKIVCFLCVSVPALFFLCMPLCYDLLSVRFNLFCPADFGYFCLITWAVFCVPNPAYSVKHFCTYLWACQVLLFGSYLSPICVIPWPSWLVWCHDHASTPWCGSGHFENNSCHALAGARHSAWRRHCIWDSTTLQLSFVGLLQFPSSRKCCRVLGFEILLLGLHCSFLME